MFFTNDDSTELYNVNYVRRLYIDEVDRQCSRWAVKAEIDDRTSEDHEYKVLRYFPSEDIAKTWLIRVLYRFGSNMARDTK